MRGYDVAKLDAEIVCFGDTSIKVIKPYWLALLKLQSYVGNPLERDRDLQDLYFLVSNYCDCIDQAKRLFLPDGIDHDLIERESFDFRLDGAELIVRDCRRFSPDVTRQVCDFIRAFDYLELVKALAIAAHIQSADAEKIVQAFIN